jgi:hypothetical protein
MSIGSVDIIGTTMTAIVIETTIAAIVSAVAEKKHMSRRRLGARLFWKSGSGTATWTPA